MTNTGNPRRLRRTLEGYEVTESCRPIASGLSFPDAFDILRETGDYLPSFFDVVHLKHGDILEDIIEKGFGFKCWKVLGQVPYPFMQ